MSNYCTARKDDDPPCLHYICGCLFVCTSKSVYVCINIKVFNKYSGKADTLSRGNIITLITHCTVALSKFVLA